MLPASNLQKITRLTRGIGHKSRGGVNGSTAHGYLDGVKPSGGQVPKLMLFGGIIQGHHLLIL